MRVMMSGRGGIVCGGICWSEVYTAVHSSRESRISQVAVIKNIKKYSGLRGEFDTRTVSYFPESKRESRRQAGSPGSLVESTASCGAKG